MMDESGDKENQTIAGTVAKIQEMATRQDVMAKSIEQLIFISLLIVEAVAPDHAGPPPPVLEKEEIDRRCQEALAVKEAATVEGPVDEKKRRKEEKAAQKEQKKKE